MAQKLEAAAKKDFGSKLMTLAVRAGRDRAGRGQRLSALMLKQGRRPRPAGRARPGAATEKPPASAVGAAHASRWLVGLFLGPALLVLLALVRYPIVVHDLAQPAQRRRFHASSAWTTTSPCSPRRRRAGPSSTTSSGCSWRRAWSPRSGLVFAVLTETGPAGTAFKAILFMPMAISFLAAGVTFRLVYDESPDRGALNAVVVAVHDAFAPPSRYYGATARDGTGLVPDGAGSRHRRGRELPSCCRWSG